MRVLIATDTYPPDLSGSSYFAHRLAAGLAARGNDVHVVCASDTGERRSLRADGVLLHRLRSRRLLVHPTVRFVPPPGVPSTLRRIVDDVEPDVLHTQDHFTIGRAAMRAARRRGIPIVATNHFMPDNLLPYLPHWLHAPIARLAWLDFHRVYGRADHVTAPTRTAADLVAATGFRLPVEPVSCGVDLARFGERGGVDAPRRRARKELELDDRPTVAFVGRLDAEKRLDELIRALAVVRSRVDVQLVLAGSGTRRAELERLAARLGVAEHVRFLGFVPDELLPAVYAAADVFAMPGVAELQSIATLEALASGLPVVLADAVALPQLVRQGDNGYLFTPGDVAGLASRLTGILESEEDRHRMGAASRALAAAHGETGTLGRFEEIYAALTATRPAGSRRSRRRR